MTYYYVHPESGSTMMADEPPARVMHDPCVELTDRAGYLRACAEFGEVPEPHPDPCPETRRRIRVAVAAWAYEFHNDPIMTDGEFDALAREIDLDRSTANSDLDRWFIDNFNPDTGQWVHRHPNQAGLERVYQVLRGKVGLSMAQLQMWICAA